MLEMGITFDFGQLVMDNDFAGMIKDVVQGIPVTDRTLSTDIIQEVGPFKDFLSHEDTLLNMKSMSRPKLIDRSRREDWESKGSMDLYEKASEEARHILKTHKPPQLPEAIVSSIRSIIRETEEELGVSSFSETTA